MLAERGVRIRSTKQPSAETDRPGEPTIDSYNIFTVRHLAQLHTERIAGAEVPVIDFAADGADVGIVNYGINNLFSVAKAFRQLGRTVQIIDSPAQVRAARCLVLPGMGAFPDGMDELRQRDLVSAIVERAAAGTPILGICLGLQLLFTESEEFGNHRGLDLISGKVIMIQPKVSLKIPQIGWNRLTLRDPSHPLFTDLPPDGEIYFAQSYYPVPNHAEASVATTTYGDQEFCVAVHKDNLFATLFHPEKSGEVGLTVLKNFCNHYKI